jgi:membrane protease YdiL (CAAX protease family)
MNDDDSQSTATDYWSDARTPLSSLLFLIPWIVVYEFGVFVMGQDQPDVVRNGADFWMRSALSQLGFGNGLLLPGIVVTVLLASHVLRKNPWEVRFDTQLGMLAESVLLAIGLVAVGQCHDIIFRHVAIGNVSDPQVASTAMLNTIGPMTRAVTFIGAGVYEEVMFRLLLVPAAFLVFRMFEFPSKWAAVMAAVCTSFLFAIAHHIGPSAEALNLFAFSFRAAAGLFFASVFLLRGFGITVGCHAAYDLLVGVLLATPQE